MKRTFLVKKDPTIEAQDNWLIMDYRQYAAWRETDEGKNREIVFGKFEACSEDDSIISWSAMKSQQRVEKGLPSQAVHPKPRRRNTVPSHVLQHHDLSRV